MEQQKIRIRRLGSVTFGLVLIALGLLFMIHLFFPALNYMVIFRFWPVILILLGAEVLYGSRYKTYEIIGNDGKIVEQCKVIYDVPAIFMTMSLTFFTLFLAWVDWAYMNQIGYIHIG